MSSSNPPNVNNYLMSISRPGAAKKKTTLQTSASPKRRKTLTPTPREQTATPLTPTAELASMIEVLKRKALDFDPNAMAKWGRGNRVPFMFLALTFHLISKQTERIVIMDIICNMLRTVIHTTPEDLLPAVYLSARRIVPENESLELGIGEDTIIKALAEAFGMIEKDVRERYHAEGDLGIVAQKSRSSQSMIRQLEPLTVTKVFNTLHALAKESGKDSNKKKKNHMKSLLVAATDIEPQYLTRLLQLKMRIGFAEQTLLAALGQAAVYSEQHSTPPPHVQFPLEEAARIVKQVYSLLPVYDEIIPALLSGGVWNLPKTCTFTLGIPVGPMLAKSSKGVSEIVQKFCWCQFSAPTGQQEFR